eukprot:352507-Chlamydomonas_euryale.AAC.10
MDKKARSKPMKEIVQRITSFNEFELAGTAHAACMPISAVHGQGFRGSALAPTHAARHRA